MFFLTRKCREDILVRFSLQYTKGQHEVRNGEGNEDANEKFMEIKEAYTTLINDEKRTAYNNKIGFYHSDPPPDFKREWTFQVREGTV